MKRPERLRILGRRWDVEYSASGLEKDEIGCADIEKQQITVKDGLKPEQERTTLLHESIHAIADTLGLNLTEEQVQGLETGLFAMNKENPRLFSYLRKGEK